MHPTRISLIELGKTEATMGTLVDLAMALGLEPDYLIRLRLPTGFKLTIPSPRSYDEPPRPLIVHEGRTPRGYGYRFVVLIQRRGDGYAASIPDLPGCTATGPTRQAVEASILRAGNVHLQGLRAAGRPIPTPEAYAIAMAFVG